LSRGHIDQSDFVTLTIETWSEIRNLAKQAQELT